MVESLPDRPRRIAIMTGDHTAVDPTKPGGHYNPEDIEQHQIMVSAFQSHGAYDVDVWNEHPPVLDRLRHSPPDLVVNFNDTGYLNQAVLELNLPAYMEMLGVPYTGAPPAAMVICYDKALVRMAAESLGIAVPKEVLIPAHAPLDTLPDFFPALIKPNTADGSLGITKDAVVCDAAQARAYMTWLREALPGRDALYQEYLPGPEYGIGIIGNPQSGLRILPPLEVDFSKLPKGLNPILSYESKSLPDSPYWTDIGFRKADIAALVKEKMFGGVSQLFQRLHLRDYARFDFRVAADGEPKLMEVNPNPAWESGGKLAIMSSFDGLSYPDMLRLIIDTAWARVKTRAL